VKNGILVKAAGLGALLCLGAPVWAQNQYGQNGQNPQTYGQQPQTYNPPPQGYNQGQQYTPPASAAAALQTRGVRVINIGQVIKKYQKFQQYEMSLKQQTQDLQKRVEQKKAQAQDLQKEMERPDTPAARRDEIERTMKTLQRQAQDDLDESKQRITKDEFNQMVMIYKEVEDAVAVFCRSSNIELVLQYSDAVGPEKYLPANFQQKMINRACMPIYVDPRLDISQSVIDMLNRRLASTTGGAPIHSN
jgi:Skp family chaperone for outer membrane proteins